MNKIKYTGFSLLELLITIAIIGILASIAYPAYTSHVVHVRRAEANIALSHLSAQLEQFYEINNTYQNVPLYKEYTDDGYYKLSIDSATANEYQISATPQNSQAKYDIECGILSTNQTGEKKSSKATNPEICWQ